MGCRGYYPWACNNQHKPHHVDTSAVTAQEELATIEGLNPSLIRMRSFLKHIQRPNRLISQMSLERRMLRWVMSVGNRRNRRTNPTRKPRPMNPHPKKQCTSHGAQVRPKLPPLVKSMRSKPVWDQEGAVPIFAAQKRRSTSQQEEILGVEGQLKLRRSRYYSTGHDAFSQHDPSRPSQKHRK